MNDQGPFSSPLTTPAVKKSKRNGKYAHVESKVRQYRRTIQQQNRRSARKKQKKNNDFEVMIALAPNDGEPTTTSNDENGAVSDCDDEMKLLTEENRKLLMKNGELEVRLDYMRIEISRLKSLVRLHFPGMEKTPTLNNRSANRSASFKISNRLRTPIRTISNSLLKNSKNYITFSSQETSGSDGASSSDDDRGEENGVKLATATFTTLPTFADDKRMSSSSDRPLLSRNREEPSDSGRTVRKHFLGALACPSIGIKKRWHKFAKKNNKVSPEVVVACGTPESNVTWYKGDKNSLSLIVIKTPNSKNSCKGSPFGLRKENGGASTKVALKFEYPERSKNVQSASPISVDKKDDTELVANLLPHIQDIIKSAERIKEINKKFGK